MATSAGKTHYYFYYYYFNEPTRFHDVSSSSSSSNSSSSSSSSSSRSSNISSSNSSSGQSSINGGRDGSSNPLPASQAPSISSSSSSSSMTPSPLSKVWIDIIASASAGVLARSICHPIDTIKSRFQSKTFEGYHSVAAVVRDTWKSEGIRGMYRGFSVAAFGGIPGTCAYLQTYDHCKAFLSEKTQLSPFFTYFISGIVAESVSCLWFVPVDVIKERLQIQRSRDQNVYQGPVDAFRKILKSDGVRGIYKVGASK